MSIHMFVGRVSYVQWKYYLPGLETSILDIGYLPLQSRDINESLQKWRKIDQNPIKRGSYTSKYFLTLSLKWNGLVLRL